MAQGVWDAKVAQAGASRTEVNVYGNGEKNNQTHNSQTDTFSQVISYNIEKDDNRNGIDLNDFKGINRTEYNLNEESAKVGLFIMTNSSDLKLRLNLYNQEGNRLYHSNVESVSEPGNYILGMNLRSPGKFLIKGYINGELVGERKIEVIKR